MKNISSNRLQSEPVLTETMTQHSSTQILSFRTPLIPQLKPTSSSSSSAAFSDQMFHQPQQTNHSQSHYIDNSPHESTPVRKTFKFRDFSALLSETQSPIKPADQQQQQQPSHHTSSTHHPPNNNIHNNHTQSAYLTQQSGNFRDKHMVTHQSRLSSSSSRQQQQQQQQYPKELQGNTPVIPQIDQTGYYMGGNTNNIYNPETLQNEYDEPQLITQTTSNTKLKQAHRKLINAPQNPSNIFSNSLTTTSLSTLNRRSSKNKNLSISSIKDDIKQSQPISNKLTSFSIERSSESRQTPIQKFGKVLAAATQTAKPSSSMTNIRTHAKQQLAIPSSSSTTTPSDTQTQWWVTQQAAQNTTTTLTAQILPLAQNQKPSSNNLPSVAGNNSTTRQSFSSSISTPFLKKANFHSRKSTDESQSNHKHSTSTGNSYFFGNANPFRPSSNTTTITTNNNNNNQNTFLTTQNPRKQSWNFADSVNDHNENKHRRFAAEDDLEDELNAPPTNGHRHQRVSQHFYEQDDDNSSERSSKSCHSLLDSPLSPPITSKLMMQMEKYKREQKEQQSQRHQSSLSSTPKSLSNQIKKQSFNVARTYQPFNHQRKSTSSSTSSQNQPENFNQASSTIQNQSNNNNNNSSNSNSNNNSITSSPNIHQNRSNSSSITSKRHSGSFRLTVNTAYLSKPYQKSAATNNSNSMPALPSYDNQQHNNQLAIQPSSTTTITTPVGSMSEFSTNNNFDTPSRQNRRTFLSEQSQSSSQQSQNHLYSYQINPNQLLHARVPSQDEIMEEDYDQSQASSPSPAIKKHNLKPHKAFTFTDQKLMQLQQQQQQLPESLNPTENRTLSQTHLIDNNNNNNTKTPNQEGSSRTHLEPEEPTRKESLCELNPAEIEKQAKADQKQIQLQEIQEKSQNLNTIFMNSYKNIETIIQENKFFKVPNKIEEDMLSITLTNKSLLPRKLGILSSTYKNKNSEKHRDSSASQKKILPTIAAPTPNRRASLNNIPRKNSSDSDESHAVNDSPQRHNSTRLNQHFDEDARNIQEFLHRPSGSNFLNISSRASKFYRRPSSPIITTANHDDDNHQLVNHSDQDKQTITDTSMLFVKQKLNLAHLNVSQKYAAMIAKALSHPDLSAVHSVNLSHNHLDGLAMFAISGSFSENIYSINLSNNQLGPTGTRGLIPLFDSKKYANLRKLNLENNGIADTGLNAIIPSIFSNMSIAVLNISHNRLSDSSCAFLKRLLLNSSYLQELYLYWNKFSSQGGILIAQGLSENLNIKVLDLSHNGLGSIPKLNCGQKLINACNVLESAVKHLDLSYNSFSEQECTLIAQSLSLNRSLYGIHLEGNKSLGIIDPRGFFVIPTQKNSEDIEMHSHNLQIVTQRINGVKTKGPNKMQSFDCKSLDNCWICHGWQEVRFEIKDGSSDMFSGEPAFLHLDFEDFQPIYMDKDPEDPSRFILNRMCPPNRKITFFFSDPCKNALYTSKDYAIQDFSIPEGMNLKFEQIVHTVSPTIEQQLPTTTKPISLSNPNTKTNSTSNKPNKIPLNQKPSTSQQQHSTATPKSKPTTTDATTPSNAAAAAAAELAAEEEQEKMNDVLDEGTKAMHKKFSVTYLDGTCISYHAPTFVNFVETGIQHDAIKSHHGDYELTIKAIPRNPETYFRISKTNLWHRGISVFRDYIPDSDARDQQCFEFDWNSSKLPKLLEKSDTTDDCKQILRSVYPQLRIAYKHLSSAGITNDVFCITQNPFSNFAQKSQIIDNTLVFIRDIDFNFISASNIALKPKTYRNPDKALVRNEFLEVMGRIALDKYLRNDKAKTHADAIKKFFHEEGLLNHLYEFDSPQEWRKNRYWNQECDEKLKAQLTFLKSMYNQYADSRKNEKRYFTTVKSLSLQEFKDFVMKFDLLDEFLVERDITLCFNLAMMTQIDELNSDRHFQMTFVEFLEAISRLAEKKSMVPLGEIAEEYLLEERVQLKLHYKIESLIAYIKKKNETLVQKETTTITTTQSNQQTTSTNTTTSSNSTSSDPSTINKNSQSRKSQLMPGQQLTNNLSNSQSSSTQNPPGSAASTTKTTPTPGNILAKQLQAKRHQSIAETSMNLLRAIASKNTSDPSKDNNSNSPGLLSFQEHKESNKSNLKNTINMILAKKNDVSPPETKPPSQARPSIIKQNNQQELPNSTNPPQE